MSPNDIQIISANVPYDDPTRDYLYTVTGQKHKGIIWAIERLVEKLCPSLWLERTHPEERKIFTKSIMDIARVCRVSFLIIFLNYINFRVVVPFYCFPKVIVLTTIGFYSLDVPFLKKD